MKNRRDIFYNILLTALIASTIFLASKIWLELPQFKKAKTPAPEKIVTEESFTKILRPDRIIVNTGEKNHYVLHNSYDYFLKNIDFFKGIILALREESMEEINEETYAQLMNSPSIVLSFHRELNSRIFLNLIDSEEKKKDIKETNSVDFQEIYIARDNFVCIKNKSGHFVIKDLYFDFNLDSYLDKVSKEPLPKYESLYEKYGIVSEIFYPEGYFLINQNVIYKNVLANLERQYINDLAVRFLSTNIEYVKEIREDDAVTMVYGLRSLRIKEDGELFYTNSEEYKKESPNYYKSIESCVNFISRISGLDSDIYISDSVPIKDKDREGYKISFNFRQDSIPISLIEGENYIEVEVFNDHIKSYREFYRRPGENPSNEPEKLTPVSIETIFESYMKYKDLPIEAETYKEQFDDFVKSIDYMHLCYLDSKEPEGENLLKVSIEVDIDNSRIYFDPTSGEVLPEDK